MSRPYHLYFGRPFLWRRARGVIQPVRILDRKDQPEGAPPWRFHLLDPRGQPTGDPLRIPCDQLRADHGGSRGFALSSSGVDW